jgi:hypothetical protein
MENKIKSSSKFEVKILLELTEQEARALEAIVGYGTKEFLECFYAHLGKHYLEPHESGVESLFETIKRELPEHLRKADDVRDVWTGKKIALRELQKD